MLWIVKVMSNQYYQNKVHTETYNQLIHFYSDDGDSKFYRNLIIHLQD